MELLQSQQRRDNPEEGEPTNVEELLHLVTQLSQQVSSLKQQQISPEKSQHDGDARELLQSLRDIASPQSQTRTRPNYLKLEKADALMVTKYEKDMLDILITKITSGAIQDSEILKLLRARRAYLRACSDTGSAETAKQVFESLSQEEEEEEEYVDEVLEKMAKNAQRKLDMKKITSNIQERKHTLPPDNRSAPYERRTEDNSNTEDWKRARYIKMRRDASRVIREGTGQASAHTRMTNRR